MEICFFCGHLTVTNNFLRQQFWRPKSCTIRMSSRQQLDTYVNLGEMWQCGIDSLLTHLYSPVVECHSELLSCDKKTEEIWDLEGIIPLTPVRSAREKQDFGSQNWHENPLDLWKKTTHMKHQKWWFVTSFLFNAFFSPICPSATHYRYL